MIRVGIDAGPIVGDRGGVGWHTYHLLRALVGLKEDLELVGYVGPGSLTNGLPAGWSGEGGIRWIEAGRWTIRWRGAWDRLDLFHGPNFKLRTTGRFGGVVTVHDLWLERHPEYSPKLFGQWAASARTRRTVWRAKKVVTVSAFSAGDLADRYGLPRERIAVVPNGVSEEFRPIRDQAAFDRLRRRIGLPEGPFILFVGGADPRKNHQALVRAFATRAQALNDYRLVLVGDVVHRFGDLRRTVAECGLASRVVCPGRLPVEDIRLLYAQAAVFVFPSRYEGFGMPVLEAMACGAPVITSNTTALPEVAGDAAVMVDPDDAEELAAALERVLNDSALRAALREKGFRRAKQFTWERAARETLAVYREVCVR